MYTLSLGTLRYLARGHAPVPLGTLALVVAGLIAIVVLHELSHVWIARRFGHPLVCVAINAVGVGVVFEDKPSRRYWALQVFLPMVVTAASCYALMQALAALAVFDTRSASGAISTETLMVAALATAFLTSLGDVLGVLLELRR